MKDRILPKEISEQLKEMFVQLKEPVEVMYFGQKAGCETCEDALQLAREVVELSDKLILSIYDLDEHAELARQYRVDKTPGFVLAARDGDNRIDYGVRFAGIPAGHEFGSLIHDLVLVSGRDSRLSQETRGFLSKLSKPVRLQVFVTPT